MKLVLFRHGKAQADAPKGDFARHLVTSGRDAVEQVGKRLLTEGISGARALVSPSARTAETLESLPEGLIASTEIEWVDSLYNGSVDAVLEAISSHENDATVVVIGHNPGITATALYLLDQPGPLTSSMKPGDAVMLDLDRIGRGTARLVSYHRRPETR